MPMIAITLMQCWLRTDETYYPNAKLDIYVYIVQLIANWTAAVDIQYVDLIWIVYDSVVV